MTTKKKIELLTGCPRSGKTFRVINQLNPKEKTLFLSPTNKGVNDLNSKLTELNTLPVIPLCSKTELCTLFKKLKQEMKSPSKLDEEYLKQVAEQYELIKKVEMIISEEIKLLSNSNINFGYWFEDIARVLNISPYVVQRTFTEELLRLKRGVIITTHKFCSHYRKDFLKLKLDTLIIDEYRNIPNLSYDSYNFSKEFSLKVCDLNVLKNNFIKNIQRKLSAPDDKLKTMLYSLTEQIKEQLMELKDDSFFNFELNNNLLENLQARLKNIKFDWKFKVLDSLKDYLFFFTDSECNYYFKVIEEVDLNSEKNSFYLSFTKIKLNGQTEDREPFKSLIEKTSIVILIDATPFPLDWHDYVLGTNRRIKTEIIHMEQEFKIIVDNCKYGVVHQWKKEENRTALVKFLNHLPANYQIIARSKKETKQVLKYMNIEPSKVDHFRSDKSQSVDISTNHLTMLGLPRKPTTANSWRSKFLKECPFTAEDFNEYEDMQSFIQYAFRVYKRDRSSGVLVLNLLNEDYFSHYRKENIDHIKKFYQNFMSLSWFNLGKIQILPKRKLGSGANRLRQKENLTEVINWATDIIGGVEHNLKGCLNRTIEQEVLSVFEQGEDYTKKEVSKIIKKKESTIYSIIDSLVKKKKLVEITEEKKGKRGRPTKKYRIMKNL